MKLCHYFVFGFPLFLHLHYSVKRCHNYFLDFIVFISLLIISSTSDLLVNSSGWKSLSILSISDSSSLFTNLLNSVRSAFEVLFSFSRSCFISRFSCFSILISSSFSCLDEIRFLPRRRTLSLISLFLSSVSFSLVLKSDKRNFI